MTPKYHVDIFWSDEDDCWFANAPDLKYCSAWGDTRADALRELEIAMEAWLDVARDSGKPIPEAKYVSKASHPWLDEITASR